MQDENQQARQQPQFRRSSSKKDSETESWRRESPKEQSTKKSSSSAQRPVGAKRRNNEDVTRKQSEKEVQGLRNTDGHPRGHEGHSSHSSHHRQTNAPPPPRKGSNESLTTENKISNGTLSLPSIPEKLSSESQEVLDKLVTDNPSIVGTAWVPMIDLSPSPSSVPSGNFFGGNRAFLKSTEWPMCINCHRSPMLIVAQIDRTTLPHAIAGIGLIQIFVCLACGGAGMSTPKRSICWANYVDLAVAEYSIKELNSASGALPYRRVVKWLPRTDYQHPEEIDVDYVAGWSVLGESQIRSDKVGGFPTWPNGKPDPKKISCKLCDRRMRLLLQIDSKDNVPIEWGNDGCVQVFECPNHPDSVVGLWSSA